MHGNNFNAFIISIDTSSLHVNSLISPATFSAYPSEHLKSFECYITTPIYVPVPPRAREILKKMYSNVLKFLQQKTL